MSETNGTQTIEPISGRNIILSSCVGKTNLDELKWLSESILDKVADWHETGWAYIADCSKMTPVSHAESELLVDMTKKFHAAGCKAFAFIEGKTFMIRIQAKQHTERSHTGIAEHHFKNIPDAMDWIAKEVHY